MPSFTYDFPYATKKLPVFASNVVASSQHLAATAGLRMLAKGGNAVDAAIASAIAITIVEPTMNGIGADAFCILWDGTKLVGLNASGHSPALMTPDQYAGQASMPSTGWGSVSMPGAVSLWMTLHARYGKLPFADLFEPAIKYAHDGFRVSYMVARQWARAVDRLRGQQDWVRDFMPNGRTPQAGELWKFPDQAQTLTKIAESKRRGLLSRRARRGDGQATPGRPAARCAATTSPSTRPTGSIRSASPIAARRCTRSRRRARASPPAWRSASSRTSTSPATTATGRRWRISRSRR